MRSGNGRHRRPRQAPAIFVTAGVTGAGLALPLFAASGAHAADTTTWDKVAQCESGGVWSAATGNGFYGGLQLTQEMWNDYGGTAYASRPDLASRAQQIAVAEAILDDRGPDAFPSCAVNAGLTKDGRKPRVDPGPTTRPSPRPTHGHNGGGASGEAGDDSDTAGGDQGHPSPATRTPEPSGGDSDTDRGPDVGSGSDAGADGPHAPSAPPGPSGSSSASPAPSDSGAPTDSPSGSPSDSPSGSPSTSPADPSAPSDPSGSTDPADPASPTPSDSTAPGGQDRPGDPATPPATGKHRGTPGGGTEAGDGRDGGRGRHASRGGEAPRTPPAEAGSYRVRPGDNLSEIAVSHDLPGGWPALYHRNQDVIGSDADLIHPGQVLDLGRTQG
ncbi:transglycosylase family protein [Streptomyces sp. A1-5]|nr:transglycosylase family protein [Streptomyces sp. A1-5]UJB42377.1 transglycosylase family protein [Streptomyces sp. A1-5]